MNEMQLLNNTIDLIGDDGTLEAYTYLVSNISALDVISSQVYNFLYCLAATSEKKEEALDWLEKAIVENELWYRPEVFEDEDLDTLREDNRFKTCCDLSEERYLNALKDTRTLCTWKNKTHDGIILSLHGNQQNNEINKVYWDFLKSDHLQVGYIQSEELDSYQLFRWEDNGSGPDQLHKTLKNIEWNAYEQKILSGFSAGCNTILRTLKDKHINCDKIIMMAPWMPIVEEHVTEIIETLKIKGIEVLIICGEEDEDCLPQCQLFETKAKELGLKIKTHYMDGLGHDYPENFQELVLSFMV